MNIKGKVTKTIMFGMCFSLLTAGSALANAQSIDSRSVDSQSAEVSSPELSSDTLALHKEIDQYLFNDHTKELEDMGITITYTVPVDSYVEIGILPYNDENVNYLNDIFGSDKIEVIDGQMAVLMATSDIAPDTSVSSDNTSTDVKIEEDVTLNNEILEEVPAVEDVAEDNVIYATEEIMEFETTSIEENSDVIGKDIVLDENDENKIMNITGVEAQTGVNKQENNQSFMVILGIAFITIVLAGLVLLLKKHSNAAGTKKSLN